MRSNQPPVVVDRFDHQHALTGIAVRRRPEWADECCATCSGRGARNDFIHLDSMRCRLAGCTDCDGAGWRCSNGARHVPDIVLVNGMPAWTTVVIPRRPLPPSLLPGAPVPDELAAEFAEAA